MNKENVVRYSMKYYSSVKNNGIMKFSGKWIELENVIVSYAIHTQKDKHGMHSLIIGY